MVAGRRATRPRGDEARPGGRTLDQGSRVCGLDGYADNQTAPALHRARQNRRHRKPKSDNRQGARERSRTPPPSWPGPPGGCRTAASGPAARGCAATPRSPLSSDTPRPPRTTKEGEDLGQAPTAPTAPVTPRQCHAAWSASRRSSACHAQGRETDADEAGAPGGTARRRSSDSPSRCLLGGGRTPRPERGRSARGAPPTIMKTALSWRVVSRGCAV